jgi:hypothetical protein
MQSIFFCVYLIEGECRIFCCIKRFWLNILGFICIGLVNFSNLSLCMHYVVTSVNPVHNAQVCYFNNVWLMFLVFKKNFSFQTTVGPPSSPWSFAFPTPVLYLVDPPRPVRPESGEGTFRTPGQNLISSACPSPMPSPPVLVHLHSKSAAIVLPTVLSSREHKTPFPSPVTNRLTDQVN